MRDVIEEGTAIAICLAAVVLLTCPFWMKALLWGLKTGLGALSSVGQP